MFPYPLPFSLKGTLRPKAGDRHAQNLARVPLIPPRCQSLDNLDRGGFFFFLMHSTNPGYSQSPLSPPLWAQGTKLLGKCLRVKGAMGNPPNHASSQQAGPLSQVPHNYPSACLLHLPSRHGHEAWTTTSGPSLVY